jgi:hypothetical protein
VGGGFEREGDVRGREACAGGRRVRAWACEMPGAGGVRVESGWSAGGARRLSMERVLGHFALEGAVQQRERLATAARPLQSAQLSQAAHRVGSEGRLFAWVDEPLSGRGAGQRGSLGGTASPRLRLTLVSCLARDASPRGWATRRVRAPAARLLRGAPQVLRKMRSASDMW